MSEERFDRIEAALTKLTDLHEDTHARVVQLDGRVAELTANQEAMREDLHKQTILHEDTRDRVRLIAEAVDDSKDRVGRVETEMLRRFDTVERRFMRIDARFDRVEIALRTTSELHGARLEALEEKLSKS